MSWITAMGNRNNGTVNVEAIRQLLPLTNMIEAAKGQPRSTLSDLIDRARRADSDGIVGRAIAQARREVAAQEAELKAERHNPPGGKFSLPEEICSPEPVVKPQPRKLPDNVTPIRRARPRGGTYTYLD